MAARPSPKPAPRKAMSKSAASKPHAGDDGPISQAGKANSIARRKAGNIATPGRGVSLSQAQATNKSNRDAAAKARVNLMRTTKSPATKQGQKRGG